MNNFKDSRLGALTLVAFSLWFTVNSDPTFSEDCANCSTSQDRVSPPIDKKSIDLLASPGKATVPKACLDTSQFDSPVGAVCQTSKGIKFVRVKKSGEMGWQDMKTNLVWFDAVITEPVHFEYRQLCNEKGQVLPSAWRFPSNSKKHVTLPKYGPDGKCPHGMSIKDGKCYIPNVDSDFATAEKHGFREILRDMSTHSWVSSTALSSSYRNEPFILQDGSKVDCYYDFESIFQGETGKIVPGVYGTFRSADGLPSLAIRCVSAHNSP